jgi:ribosome biogenesis GTPase A
LGDVYLPASGTGGRAKVGPQPGVTRHVQGFRVSEDPPVVVLDTPGVMTPHLEATALAGPSAPARLALVGCVADKAYDTETVCATLLSELNKQGTLHSRQP